jgi:hypothetical protein
MSKNRKRIPLIILILIVAGAGTYYFLPEEFRPGKHNEGLIMYDVTYPYYTGPMGNIIPDEMSLHFKNGEYVTELSSGGFFLNRFIVDNSKYTLTHEVKTIGVKATTHVNEETIDHMLDEFPAFDIIFTTQTDSVAGFLCHKAIGVFHDIAYPDMTLYYTDSLAIKGLENGNWCNQFAEIPGVLMQYEMEQFGMRTRLRARNFQHVEVDPEVFERLPDLQEVAVDEMMEIMRILFENLL